MHMILLIIAVLVAYSLVYLIVKTKPEWFLGKRHEKACEDMTDNAECYGRKEILIADDALWGPSSKNPKPRNSDV